ncbi:hypothetical protein GCM10020295_10670 [Streptomyces cinereospinus]
MQVSVPSASAYAVVSASPKRLASSYTLRGPTGLTFPPVPLVLWVLLRVAVHLGGRGEHEAGAGVVRDVQRVAGAEAAGLHGVQGQPQIVRRGGRGGEVQHEVGRPLDGYPLGHVGVHQREPGPVEQRRDVRGPARAEIVHAGDRRAGVQQGAAQVGADEARAAGDDGVVPGG